MFKTEYESTEVALKQTLEDKCIHRDGQAKIMLEIIALAKKLEVCSYEFAEALRYPSHIDDRKIEKLRKDMDYKYWHQCLEENQIEKYLTTTDKEKLYEKLSANTPEFNVENVYNTIYGFVGSKEATATNMIKKIYEEITNIIFKKSGSKNTEKRIQLEIPKSFRATIFYRCIPSYVSSSNSRFNLIDDLERACYLIDKGIQPDRQENITSLTDTVLRKNEMFVDSKYLEIQFFKNGNAKITFKNLDVLEKLNAWGMRGDRVK